MKRNIRHSYGKLVVLIMVTVAVIYYSMMGIKCFKHCKALVNGHVTTINFAIND